MAFKNLKAELARKNISQVEVGEVVGKTNRAVWTWLNSDNASIGVRDALTIRDKFFPELSIKYLFAEDK